MDLSKIILETLLMMAFTTLVGLAVAYLIKGLTLSFVFFDRNHLEHLVAQQRAAAYAHHREQVRIRKATEALEKRSGNEMLNLTYENENPHDREEKVNSLYKISSYYCSGVEPDADGDKPKDTTGADPLIRFYDGEV